MSAGIESLARYGFLCALNSAGRVLVPNSQPKMIATRERATGQREVLPEFIGLIGPILAGVRTGR